MNAACNFFKKLFLHRFSLINFVNIVTEAFLKESFQVTAVITAQNRFLRTFTNKSLRNYSFNKYKKFTEENITYCVKSVRIRSYSGPHFPAFGPE